MGRAVWRLRRRVGKRGTALLVFAGLDIAYALRLATARPDGQTIYAWLADPLPLWPWAALWAAVAVVCTLGSVRAFDRAAFTAAIGIKVLWCSLYLSGWALGAVQDGWAQAAIWGAFALVVWLVAGWPEPITRQGHPAWTPPSE